MNLDYKPATLNNLAAKSPRQFHGQTCPEACQSAGVGKVDKAEEPAEPPDARRDRN